jgi:hypothetical protein
MDQILLSLTSTQNAETVVLFLFFPCSWRVYLTIWNRRKTEKNKKWPQPASKLMQRLIDPARTASSELMGGGGYINDGEK